MSKCKLQKGKISILVDQKLLSEDKTEWVKDWTINCELEQGTILRIPLDSQDVKLAKKTKKQPKQKQRKKIIKQEPLVELEEKETPVLEGVIEKPPELPKVENIKGGQQMAKKEKQELIATVEQPANDSVSRELMNLAKENSSDPMVTMVLAAMAVFGGGAAMKFYRQWSEQKHEEKMEKIKMDSKNQDKSPGECQTVHAQLTAQITEVKSKVNSLESRIDVDFDGDRLERRVKKLEKWKKEKEEGEE